MITYHECRIVLLLASFLYMVDYCGLRYVMHTKFHGHKVQANGEAHLTRIRRLKTIVSI